MSEAQMTLEDIRRTQRDLALLETQHLLKQQIETLKSQSQYQSQYQSQHQSSQSQHSSKSFDYRIRKMTNSIKDLEKRLDYFIKFKEIYDSVEFDRKKQDEVRRQVWLIESEIRDKYRKLADDEIREKTGELNKQIALFETKIKQTLLKPYNCFHCDVSGMLFNSMTCLMCNQIIRFSS